MKGYRKFTLGLAYLATMTWLAFRLIAAGQHDLTGLGIFATGMATGLGVIVWGNVQVARTGTATPPPTTSS